MPPMHPMHPQQALAAQSPQRAELLHDIRNQINALCGLVQLMSRGTAQLGAHATEELAGQVLRGLVQQFDQLAACPPATCESQPLALLPPAERAVA